MKRIRLGACLCWLVFAIFGAGIVPAAAQNCVGGPALALKPPNSNYGIKATVPALPAGATGFSSVCFNLPAIGGTPGNWRIDPNSVTVLTSPARNCTIVVPPVKITVLAAASWNVGGGGDAAYVQWASACAQTGQPAAVSLSAVANAPLVGATATWTANDPASTKVTAPATIIVRRLVANAPIPFWAYGALAACLLLILTWKSRSPA